MGATTGIEWTDATWNPIGGCSIKSPGCKPCYAQKLAGTRLKHHPLYAGTTSVVNGKPVFNGHLTHAPFDHDVWSWPMRWRGAKNPKLGPGMPSLIFVGDMSDLFHENRPAAIILRVLDVARRCSYDGGGVAPDHILQLLTKRPDRMAELLHVLRWNGEALEFGATAGRPIVLKNLWCGFSAERQAEFDARWPYVRALAQLGYTIYVSCEPLLEGIVLPPDFLALGRRAQVIVGGLSGSPDRPMHPSWPRSLRDQCVPAGVAFHFKQWGELAPVREGDEFRRGVWIVPDGRHADLDSDNDLWDETGAVTMHRFGKKAAGALLDGREWREFPA